MRPVRSACRSRCAVASAAFSSSIASIAGRRCVICSGTAGSETSAPRSQAAALLAGAGGVNCSCAAWREARLPPPPPVRAAWRFPLAPRARSPPPARLRAAACAPAAPAARRCAWPPPRRTTCAATRCRRQRTCAAPAPLFAPSTSKATTAKCCRWRCRRCVAGRACHARSSSAAKAWWRPGRKPYLTPYRGSARAPARRRTCTSSTQRRRLASTCLPPAAAASAGACRLAARVRCSRGVRCAG